MKLFGSIPRPPRRMSMAVPPTEHEEQAEIFNWHLKRAETFPDLLLLYAIANAGAGRQAGQAGKMRAEGVKPGMPDMCLPVALGGYHGLYIELKRGKALNVKYTSPISPVQMVKLQLLKEQGYYTAVAYGADIAKQIIEFYISQPRTVVVNPPPALIAKEEAE